ncbi:hypothetical protein QTV49_004315 [Vibrio vulnificus]|nr:hypothetical protein [Vibrio vulnificus]
MNDTHQTPEENINFVYNLLNGKYSLKTKLSECGNISVNSTQYGRGAFRFEWEESETGYGATLTIGYGLYKEGVLISFIKMIKRSDESQIKLIFTQNPTTYKGDEEFVCTDNLTEQNFTKELISLIQARAKELSHLGHLNEYPATLLDALKNAVSGDGFILLSGISSYSGVGTVSAIKKVREEWGCSFLFEGIDSALKQAPYTPHRLKEYLSVTSLDSIYLSLAGMLHIPMNMYHSEKEHREAIEVSKVLIRILESFRSLMLIDYKSSIDLGVSGDNELFIRLKCSKDLSGLSEIESDLLELAKSNDGVKNWISELTKRNNTDFITLNHKSVMNPLEMAYIKASIGEPLSKDLNELTELSVKLLEKTKADNISHVSVSILLDIPTNVAADLIIFLENKNILVRDLSSTYKFKLSDVGINVREKQGKTASLDDTLLGNHK